MPIVRATVTLDCVTGLPEDAATNTYHFDALSEGNADNMLDLLEDLYATEGDADPLISLMSDELAEGTGRIKLYNLSDTEPRAPFASREITATPADSPGLPSEVSICVSFQGDPVSGQPQSRRRGRVYIPWMTEANNVAGRPSSTLIGNLGDAFTEFATAASSSVSVDWVVWSPTNEAAVGLTNGWVDNAWDTQRRRGFAPTTRSTWP